MKNLKGSEKCRDALVSYPMLIFQRYIYMSIHGPCRIFVEYYNFLFSVINNLLICKN